MLELLLGAAEERNRFTDPSILPCQCRLLLNNVHESISKTTTFLSELVQTCASLHKPKRSASRKLNQLGQNFDKVVLRTSSTVPHSQYKIYVSFRMHIYAQ